MYIAIGKNPLTMNFQNLHKVENFQFYLDVAFKNASKKVDLERSKRIKERMAKSKYLEILRIQEVKKSLCKSLQNILKDFPSFDSLPLFYKELSKCLLDYREVKRSLGALNWGKDKIEYFYGIYFRKIKNSQQLRGINVLRREFYGRVSSVMKQIQNQLLILEETRKIMKRFPTIKTSIKTIAIIGFPNVGKTTLLFKLTGSKPEINSYSFTTKNINIAYIEEKNKKIQLIDTPGSLNRFEKMNVIEKQAYLAMKLVAEQFIYVFDLTEPYPLEKQIKLYESIKQLKKPIIAYLSKTDIVDKKIVEEFIKKYPAVTDSEELKKKLL